MKDLNHAIFLNKIITNKASTNYRHIDIIFYAGGGGGCVLYNNMFINNQFEFKFIFLIAVRPSYTLHKKNLKLKLIV